MKKFFFLFFFLLINISYTNAKDGVYFLDIDYVLNNSNSGKVIIDKLKNINSKNFSKFEEEEDKLKLQENEINKIKNIISKQELNTKIQNLKKNIDIYQKNKNNQLKEFDKLKNKELDSFFKKITPIIEEFMEINSIKIILDKKNIFIANSNYDITNELIEFLNTKLNK